MSAAPVVFDRVWKKFRRGEHHDSLRDLIPSLFRRACAPRSVGLAAEEFWALEDVSFEVQAGEALGIIGPNGAGKSTTLKLLTRILKPTRGHAAVRGRAGALIELAAGFHPDLTGRENIYLQGAVLGMKQAEIARRFDDIVEFAGIPDFIDTPVKRYSSGMIARLGFAIPAHFNPDVLLIDEVLAVGDFSFQQRCYERLHEFRRAGAAIVFVSHNMQAIASSCDRAMLLRPHQPALIGAVADVTAAYASAAAASVDQRVSLVSLRLFEPGRVDSVRQPIAPGTLLRLELELRCQTALPRCGVALQVMRSDGLVMFTGASMMDGVETLDLDAGTQLRCAVGFRANLLRGTYLVTAILMDEARAWAPVTLTNLASFVVSETTRVAGCAELEPQYELSVLGLCMNAVATP